MAQQLNFILYVDGMFISPHSTLGEAKVAARDHIVAGNHNVSIRTTNTEPGTPDREFHYDKGEWVVLRPQRL